MIKKYILNPEKKKDCDNLPIEKKEAILKQIEDLEKNYYTQLERIRLLKMYFSDESESEKNVFGQGVNGRYKYEDNHRRKYKERAWNRRE
jgi:hypothetical protein